MGDRTPYGAQRLKAKVLEIIDRRVAVCQSEEARYAQMAAAGGGILGSVEIARRSEATERSAKFEAQLIRDMIASLPAAGARPQGSG